jgi:uncharacterized membrane protein
MQSRTTNINSNTLRRIAVITAALTVLVALDGIYMLAVNYHPDDTSNNGFGSFHPSDGTTVLIAAALLLIFTVVAFVMSGRAQKANVTAPAGEQAGAEATIEATKEISSETQG